MRVENQPHGRLSEIIFDHAFTVHPYKHPTIGSMVDLEAASIADVREFHSTYYVPENATVTIVGDFDAEQTLQMVNQYCARSEGEAPGSEGPCRRSPSRRRNAVPSSRKRPLPAVVVAYHITATAIRMRIRCTSRPRSCPMARAREFRASSSTTSASR